MKIKEYVKKLNSFVIRNRVKDSSDITWEKGADGVRAFLANTQPISGGGGSTSEYNGYFKVKKYTEDEVDTYWVINGADEDAVNAGVVTVGITNLNCISQDVADVDGVGVIYIRIFYDQLLEEYDYEFLFATTLPSVEQEVFIALATVSATGVIGQQWTDGTINLNGQYVT